MPTPSRSDPVDTDLYMKYLGCLGLLTECSIYVPEDIRDSIIQAMEDACEKYPLRWRRILNRIEVEPERMGGTS